MIPDENATLIKEHDGIMDFNFDANPQNFLTLRVRNSGSAVTKPQKPDYVAAGFFKAPPKVEDNSVIWTDFKARVVTGIAALAFTALLVVDDGVVEFLIVANSLRSTFEQAGLVFIPVQQSQL